MPTLTAPDTGKAIVVDATVKIAINDLSQIGPEKAILLDNATGIRYLNPCSQVPQ
jgi:hypothetical protein